MRNAYATVSDSKAKYTIMLYHFVQWISFWSTFSDILLPYCLSLDGLDWTVRIASRFIIFSLYRRVYLPK